MALKSTAAVAAILVVTSAGAVTQARAQGFVNGSPVFQADVDRQNAELEAKRAEIRAKAAVPTAYPKHMEGGGKPEIAPEKPPVVYLDKPETPGTIIVDTGGRKLYYILGPKKAYQYPISVGRDGFQWTGTEKISRIASWPTWTPPPEMHQRQKGLPETVTGGLINPLGARALYLGATIYRIHGTNNERSIGKASSSGCFRMMNQHVIHLSTLAHVGTTVRVVANYSGVSESAPLSSLFDFGSDEPTSSTKPAPKAKAKAAVKPKPKPATEKAAAKPAASEQTAKAN
ncbi:MAG: L,D-transpeptidase [Proteobacteria bacterium]|nr:L,D-transpeptidase [Pseudomonadota bacterium]